MANQVSKKITFNEPAPKNIQNAGIVRVENFNRVVEDVTTLFERTEPIVNYKNLGNSSSNTNIDWEQALTQELNLDNNPSLTFANGEIGTTYTLLLKQQLSGLRTITWPNSVIWNGGSAPTLQTLGGGGGIDTTFSIGSGFNAYINNDTILIQPDGKIIVGGNFTQYNGVSINRIVRLNFDGSIDNTFNVGTGFNGTVNGLTLQPDGKILVGGWFTSYNGTSLNYIVRLNSDGSVDNTFNIGTGFNEAPWVIVVQTDGKLVIGGYFATYNGSTSNRLIRLNSDGSVDNTFNIGTGFSIAYGQDIYDIILQSDQKIVVVGNFTSYNGTAINRIVRINSDGSIDNTFNPGTGLNNIVYAIEIVSGGKMVMVGQFTTYNGNSSTFIARINSDGSFDNTFNVGVGFTGSYNSALKIQTDGKILVSGNFSQYQGLNYNDIIRLNSDGTVDTSFNIGTGSSSNITSIAIQTDGKILAGGNFTSFNGTLLNRLVRLEGLPPLSYNTVKFDYNGAYYIGSY